MHVLYFVLFLLAVVCFTVAAFRDYRNNSGSVGVNLMALGLAFGFAVFMVQQARLL